jgi:hypothetical protein
MAYPSGRRTIGTVGRRRTIGAIVLAALMLVPAAIAFACNPQASISTNKAVYAPGETMTVVGRSFNANQSLTVSVPGDSKAVNTGNSRGFVTILRAPGNPGAYTVMASGSARGLPARTSIRVATTPASGRSDGGSSGGSGRDFGRPGIQRSAGSERGSGPGGGGGQPAVGSPTSAPASSGGGSGAVVSSAGQPVFAASAPPADSFGAQAGAADERSAGRSPSEQTATGNLWSGLGNGSAPSLAGVDTAADDGTGSPLVLGIVLLAIGLLTLLTGFGVAQARRRRALADVGSGH